MNRFGLSEKQLQLITEAVGRFDGIREALVFGSRAMGNHKPGSDVDIAIKGRNVAMELGTLLNEELPLPHYFDVVHYDSLENESLIRHIDEQGVVFFSRQSEMHGGNHETV